METPLFPLDSNATVALPQMNFNNIQGNDNLLFIIIGLAQKVHLDGFRKLSRPFSMDFLYVQIQRVWHYHC